MVGRIPYTWGSHIPHTIETFKLPSTATFLFKEEEAAIDMLKMELWSRKVLKNRILLLLLVLTSIAWLFSITISCNSLLVYFENTDLMLSHFKIVLVPVMAFHYNTIRISESILKRLKSNQVWFRFCSLLFFIVHSYYKSFSLKNREQELLLSLVEHYYYYILLFSSQL